MPKRPPRVVRELSVPPDLSGDGPTCALVAGGIGALAAGGTGALVAGGTGALVAGGTGALAAGGTGALVAGGTGALAAGGTGALAAGGTGASVRGELWHADVMALLGKLADGSVDLVVTDPPYAIAKAAWDEFASMEVYLDWCDRWLAEVARVLAPHGSAYVCGFSENLADVKARSARRFASCRWLVWYYRNKANLGRDWGRSHESILHLRKVDARLDVDAIRIPYNGHTTKYPARVQAVSSQYGGEGARRDRWEPNPLGAKPRDVIELPVICNGMAEKTPHATQKPEALIEKLILASSAPGQLVVDPFVGSGTTAVVAARLGRSWIAGDGDARFVGLTRERLAAQAAQARAVQAGQTGATQVAQAGAAQAGQVGAVQAGQVGAAQVAGAAPAAQAGAAQVAQAGAAPAAEADTAQARRDPLPPRSRAPQARRDPPQKSRGSQAPAAAHPAEPRAPQARRDPPAVPASKHPGPREVPAQAATLQGVLRFDPPTVAARDHAPYRKRRGRRPT